MDTSESAPQSATLSLALSTQPPSAGREETTETTEVRSGPAPSGPQPAPQVAIPADIWEKPCSELDSLFGGDADASIYGELTAGSVSKIMRIILADMREEQESLAGNSTIDPVSFLDLGSGTMRNSIQVASEMVTNVQEEKDQDQDQDYLYDLPELCQREVASDSDSDDS
jgi:hypothetical protein